ISGRAGQKRELAQGLCAERTHRELRLTARPVSQPGAGAEQAAFRCVVDVPGEVVAPALGVRLRIAVSPAAGPQDDSSPQSARQAVLRPWKPGDRVRLRHSGGPRKVKEVLERLKVTGENRALWPVLELDGRIVWMRGVELEPEPGIELHATPLEETSETPSAGEACAES
ncbi:MAG: tRNA lysidine(34) synthetase TilS, partial [Terracidiphilus sp.]